MITSPAGTDATDGAVKVEAAPWIAVSCAWANELEPLTATITHDVPDWPQAPLTVTPIGEPVVAAAELSYS
jgi:regulation of enolase protein 1 (concanavalin A-like superfamily)